MTGAEHYREAEQLIRPHPYPADSRILVVPAPDVLALAQVHATLALAAATALAQPDAPSWADKTWAAWSAAAGEAQKAGTP